MSKKILDVQGVNKSFGKLKALNEVVMQLQARLTQSLVRRCR